MAGVELVPALDYDVANINISLNDQSADLMPNGTPIDIPSDKDELPTVAWHYDSFPFVCVTMISDCTGMVGGETALRTATGDVMKVRGPAMVCILFSLSMNYANVTRAQQW